MDEESMKRLAEMTEKTTINEIELFRISLLKNEQKEGVKMSY